MKILIIGSCGSGKSTLAKNISKILNLPLISLDQCYWKPSWVRTETEEWRNKVYELVKQDNWVMDGNYQSTFDIRFPVSDVIIILDVNRFTCLYRAIKRRILRNRTDVLDGCDEKIDFKLIKWILWDYGTRGKKLIREYTEKYNNKKIIIVKSNKNLNNIVDLVLEK